MLRGSQPGTHMERPLTARESEILGLLARGLTQREIAATLLISANTVGHHIEHVISKLGVHSRTMAVAAGDPAGWSPCPRWLTVRRCRFSRGTPRRRPLHSPSASRRRYLAGLLRARSCGDRSAGRSGVVLLACAVSFLPLGSRRGQSRSQPAERSRCRPCAADIPSKGGRDGGIHGTGPVVRR